LQALCSSLPVGFTGLCSTVRLQPAADFPPRLIDKLIETTKRVCVNEWQDLVADDVVFDGPVQHARGKAAFVNLTAQFLGAHRATRLLRRIADGSTVTTRAGSSTRTGASPTCCAAPHTETFDVPLTANSLGQGGRACLE
jgi:hypothetical protein